VIVTTGLSSAENTNLGTYTKLKNSAESWGLETG